MVCPHSGLRVYPSFIVKVSEMHVIKKRMIRLHYKTDCPYCHRILNYLLNPLAGMGVIMLDLVVLYRYRPTPEYNTALEFARNVYGREEIAAPTVIDVTTDDYKYFVPMSATAIGGGVKSAVANMTRVFLAYLCNHTIVSNGWRRKLRIQDLLRNEQIRKCYDGV